MIDCIAWCALSDDGIKCNDGVVWYGFVDDDTRNVVYNYKNYVFYCEVNVRKTRNKNYI